MSSVARRPRAMSSFAMLFFRISGPPKLRLRFVSDKTPLREMASQTTQFIRYNRHSSSPRHGAFAPLFRRRAMTIKVGDRLPAGTLSEFIEVETEGCTIGPNQFKVDDLTKGKKVVIFGLPGAFTPTCSAQHVPSYVKHYDELKAKGVDDILCLSVNDAFVMGAWAKDQHAAGKVRMMGDGSAAYTKALGLELDLTARGMGVRCQRFSALIEDGVVKALNIEAPGKFEVSGAETMLKQLG
jgi:peroxiredoxin